MRTEIGNPAVSSFSLSEVRTKTLFVTLMLVAWLLLTTQRAHAEAWDFNVSLYFGAASYSEKSVKLKSDYTSGTESVALLKSGVEVDRLMVSPDVEGQVVFNVPISDSITRFEAQSISGDSLLDVSPPQYIYARNYRPLKPVLYLRDKQIVGSKWRPSGNSGRRSIRLKIYVNGRLRMNRPVQPSTRFRFPAIKLRPGRNLIRVVSYNAWGSTGSKNYPVWNLGSAPKGGSYLLVDKSDFRMYHVERGAFVASFPVGIGSKKTPTPSGTFKTGLRKKMPTKTGQWGKARIRMNKSSGSRWSGLYIHGTVLPNRIGRPRSDGSIVLYNYNLQHILDHAKGQTKVIVRR